MVIYDPPSWIKPVSPQFQPVQDFLQGRVILFLRIVLWKMLFGFIELTAYFAAEAPAPSRSAQQCRKWEWGIRTSPALVIQRTCSWEYKNRSIHSEGKMRERERTQKETESKAKRVAVCMFKCVCLLFCVSLQARSRSQASPSIKTQQIAPASANEIGTEHEIQ